MSIASIIAKGAGLNKGKSKQCTCRYWTGNKKHIDKVIELAKENGFEKNRISEYVYVYLKGKCSIVIDYRNTKGDITLFITENR